MNATGKRRLLKLADFLENEVEPKRFEMSWWGHGHEEKHTPLCGTTACALGWASAVPSLYRAGVRLNPPHRSTRFVGGTPVTIARKVFGMTHTEFVEAFIPDRAHRLSGRSGIRAVVKTLRKMAARKARAA